MLRHSDQRQKLHLKPQKAATVLEFGGLVSTAALAVWYRQHHFREFQIYVYQFSQKASGQQSLAHDPTRVSYDLR